MAQKDENAKKDVASKVNTEVKEAARKTGGKKFKLADPNTSYQEPGFTLVGDQAKELPANPSTNLAARISSGYIIEAK